MARIQRISKFEHFKILGDSRRLAILRRLMVQPETLSSLGKILGEHPARVRHHLMQLEQVGVIEVAETRQKRGVIEKFYRAKAGAFVFQEMILPAGYEQNGESLVILGSHDLALELLEQQFKPGAGQPSVLSLPTGSLEGLVALRQGQGHLAGCHLLDEASGDYNLPHIRHLFPDRPVRVITLAHREQGLMVAPHNPQQIRGVEDLLRPGIHLVNRNPGSGTRLWLDQKLKQMGMKGAQIGGYTNEVRTHTQAAQAVAQGKADLGLGLKAAARQFQLDFIPLFQERYDLVIPEEFIQNRQLDRLLDHIQTRLFRQAVEEMDGYDTAHTGEQVGE